MKDSDSRILLCIVIKNGCCIIFRSIIDAICFPVWISLRENGIQAIRNIFFSIIDGENYRPLISCKFLIIIYLHLSSNVVYLLNLMQHIATVENDLAFQALFVVENVLVLNQYNYHIHIVQELIEVVVLVLGNLVLLEERIVAAKRPRKVTLLSLEHLESLVTRDNRRHFPCR